MPTGKKKDPNRTEDMCNICLVLKPMSEFNWSDKSRGYYKSRCRACDAAFNAAPRARAKRAAYEKTPKCKAIRSIYSKTPKSKARHSGYNKMPKYKAYQVTYKQTPKYKAQQKIYRNTPEGKAIIRAGGDAWRKDNPGRVRANMRRYQASKLKRTPPWSEEEAIRLFYENCPEGMVVDHIVPLQGKLVSGLHVLSNLQYLTPTGNSQKLNKFNPIEFNGLNKKDKESKE